MRPVRSQSGACRAALSMVAVGLLLGWLGVGQAMADTVAATSDSSRLWATLMAEAKALNLPTRFLEQVPAQFVAFEFEDLHAFAAEYHPAEHRMVLARSLSLNAAGRTLRPLARLTHKELETLYHELFHAYMDFIEQEAGLLPAPLSLMAFAREQQRCRYQHVLITPVLQKKTVTEERFLSETESWEALNETWAVFVGWAVWTQLEVEKAGGRETRSSGRSRQVSAWMARLSQAEQNAVLSGYYEPEDPAEKVMARKRFLAPDFRLSAPELLRLMKDVLGSPTDMIRQADQVLTRAGGAPPARGACVAPPVP